jgi:hypothetical protein
MCVGRGAVLSHTDFGLFSGSEVVAKQTSIMTSQATNLLPGFGLPLNFTPEAPLRRARTRTSLNPVHPVLHTWHGCALFPTALESDDFRSVFTVHDLGVYRNVNPNT